MPLKRRAILIESSGVRGSDDLPGARADVKNFKQYLCSDTGGAWEDDEIRILNSPSWMDVLLELWVAKDFDYVFMTFSGHGYHLRNGRSLDDTVVCLSDEDVRVRDMNPANPRCLFIIDACRKIITTEILLEGMVTKMFKTSAEYSDRNRIGSSTMPKYKVQRRESLDYILVI